MPYQPISTLWHSALGLILGYQVDLGCDTDFVMYYSLCIKIFPEKMHAINQS